MKYKDIKTETPMKDCRCEVITNLGRIFEVDYFEYYGIFSDDYGKDIGWINNGENPELVIKWRVI